tara:strand:+ start:6550 stop:7365 length:816 start_codon:yes stop_codon:yes gene_type:complete
MIIGHQFPHFLADTANSIEHHNKDSECDFKVVFAIDHDEDVANKLIKIYGRDRVYRSESKNGWGKGILRTIFHAMDFFADHHYFTELVTFDSDALCTGPFVDHMHDSAANNPLEPPVFFSGTIWGVPDYDKPDLYKFRDKGFMTGEWEFVWKLVAGPCMLWTQRCLDFLIESGWRPGPSYDKEYYKHVTFAHDQISTYFKSAGACSFDDTGTIMNVRWRTPLPVIELPNYGAVPDVKPGTSIIHPVVSSSYTEENCRRYFKSLRANKPTII